MPPSIVQPGFISGRLTVVSEAEKDRFGKRWWACKCSCGNEVVVAGRSLAGRKTLSCGCLRWDNKVKPGDVYGRLTVIGVYGRGSRGDVTWECLCSCGNTHVTTSSNLTRGHTNSCGCYCSEVRAELSTTHGMTGTRVYSIWKDMKARCNDPNQQEYKNYGGRGINVCDGWLSFEEFYRWAETSGYQEHLTLDRIDVNSGYSPHNCRWSTLKEQNNNTRKNIYIEGEPLVYVMERNGIYDELDQAAIRVRIRKLNWSVDKALKTPIERRVPRRDKKCHQ